MSVPVLTYHSLNVLQNSYEKNDHIALAEDLRTIDKLGFRIVSLDRVLDWYEGLVPNDAIMDTVAITLDDGSSLDYHDVSHPTCGGQTSMINVLRDFRREVGVERQPESVISSFVIASPEARAEMDSKMLLGNGWWSDDWWSLAIASGLMTIESHSWDHMHDVLDVVAQRDNRKGDFQWVDTYADCCAQVVQSSQYIMKVAGRHPAYFAYPWGQASSYLVQHFMPEFKAQHRYRAAFGTDAKPVTRSDNVWFLPRYVCGRDWRSAKELIGILTG